MLDQKTITHIFSIFHQLNPFPQPELEYKDPYTLLVAVVLSAQATDISVNKATKLLFEKHDSAEKMMTLGVDGIKQYIKTIGLYNAKAENLFKLSCLLLEKHNGVVPSDRESLENLPGVGRKTANVVLNIAFGQPTLAVDTHIFRVSNRIGLCETTNPLKTEEALLNVIPQAYLKEAHHWLILHGRYICKARKPECARCPILHLCLYDGKTLS